MFEKAFEKDRYTPQGAERDLRNVIGPMTRAQFMALLTADFCAYDHDFPLSYKR